MTAFKDFEQIYIYKNVAVRIILFNSVLYKNILQIKEKLCRSELELKKQIN